MRPDCDQILKFPIFSEYLKLYEIEDSLYNSQLLNTIYPDKKFISSFLPPRNYTPEKINEQFYTEKLDRLINKFQKK